MWARRLRVLLLLLLLMLLLCRGVPERGRDCWGSSGDIPWHNSGWHDWRLPAASSHGYTASVRSRSHRRVRVVVRQRSGPIREVFDRGEYRDRLTADERLLRGAHDVREALVVPARTPQARAE